MATLMSPQPHALLAFEDGECIAAFYMPELGTQAVTTTTAAIEEGDHLMLTLHT